MEIVNISGYRFFDVSDVRDLQARIKDFCSNLTMRGSVLLAHEGINLYVAGTRPVVDTFLNFMHGTLGLPQLDYKESLSATIPFQRMLVKVKKEVIPIGDPDIKPNEFTGTNLSAKDFKKWLDEKKDMIILDTRNDYEIHMGKFSGAQDLNVRTFREFGRRAHELPEEWKHKPVVSYCTGGIRCEKASALLMQKHGFKEVYQLQGGILRYLEEVGNDHFEGECFVFDRRIGLDATLTRTDSGLCFACRHPLKPEELKSPDFVLNVSCPYCIEK